LDHEMIIDILLQLLALACITGPMLLADRAMTRRIDRERNGK